MENYNIIHTRPNIALAVGMVARFSVNPKENHMMAIKRIMRYLKGTQEDGLWYKLGGNLDLKVFTSVDWAGSLDDRKNTSDGALFLGNILVSWTRKNKNCTSQSITKEKNVGAIVNCSNISWFKKLLVGMKI